MSAGVEQVIRMARQMGLRLTSGLPPRCSRCGRYKRRRRVRYFGGARDTYRCAWCDERSQGRAMLP